MEPKDSPSAPLTRRHTMTSNTASQSAESSSPAISVTVRKMFKDMAYPGGIILARRLIVDVDAKTNRMEKVVITIVKDARIMVNILRRWGDGRCLVLVGGALRTMFPSRGTKGSFSFGGLAGSRFRSFSKGSIPIPTCDFRLLAWSIGGWVSRCLGDVSPASRFVQGRTTSGGEGDEATMSFESGFELAIRGFLVKLRQCR